MADDEDPLLSVADVARLLGVTGQTVREWIKDDKLRAHRAGARFWRIRKSEVDRMLSEQSNRPPERSGPRPAAGREARDLLSSLITNPERGGDHGG
jgi:excisionase family DNA binding protein